MIPQSAVIMEVVDPTQPKANTDLEKALQYDKILKLFENKHTKNLHEPHDLPFKQ